MSAPFQPRVSDMLAACGMCESWWFTPEARDRGTAVHYIAEEALQHRPVTVAPEFAGYAAALAAAIRSLGLVTVLGEHRLVHSRLGYTGRPDSIGFLQEPRGVFHAGPTIADIKSGDPAPAHGVQLALYEQLAIDADARLRPLLSAAGCRTDYPWQRVGIYVHADGTYRTEPYRDPADREVAKGMVDLLRWRHAHGLFTHRAVARDEDPSTEFQHA